MQLEKIKCRINIPLWLYTCQRPLRYLQTLLMQSINFVLYGLNYCHKNSSGTRNLHVVVLTHLKHFSYVKHHNYFTIIFVLLDNFIYFWLIENVLTKKMLIISKSLILGTCKDMHNFDTSIICIIHAQLRKIKTSLQRL